MNTVISNSNEGIIKGLKNLAELVSKTLGPKGRNIIIEDLDGIPRVTKDGVSVAEAIHPTDKFEKLGVQLVKQVARNTAKTAGDGTTTATVLAEALVQNALNLVDKGYNPVDIKRSYDRMLEVFIQGIDKLSNKDITTQDLINIATISSNNDQILGQGIAEIIENIGVDGLVSYHHSNTGEDYVEFTEGYSFDRGYLSPYFINNADDNTVEFDNPLILLYDGKIDSVKNLGTFIERTVNSKDENIQGRAMVIIASELNTENISVLINNATKNNLRVVAIKAPNYGDYQKEVLQDLAILTDTVVVSKEAGMHLENLNPEMLGGCSSIVVTKDDTTIFEGYGATEDVEARIKAIKEEAEMYEKKGKTGYMDRCITRYGDLSTNVAQIFVGGRSITEIKERKDRIEDAVCACRSAIQDGIVEGGGTTLKQVVGFWEQERDETIGEIEKAFLKSCLAPYNNILTNAGYEVETVEKFIDPKYGKFLNVETGEYVKFIEKGIIDPTKVVKTALTNAVSIAGMFILTSGVIANSNEPTPEDFHGINSIPRF